MAIGRGHERACAVQVPRALNVIVEGQEQEAVGIAQRVEHPRQGTAGRYNLPAAHAPRAIEHERHIPRPARGAGAGAGGWHDRQRKGTGAAVAGTLAIGVERQCRADRRSIQAEPDDEVAVEPLAGVDADPQTPGPSSTRTACRLQRTSATEPAASYSSSSSRSCTGFGKPGSRTGGVIREASGTASVSETVPSPTDGPGSGVPGM